MTKWVHFNHGDVGIRNLFRRCLKRLKPGGCMVLEPQDWKSYQKKKFLTQEIREAVRSIELRPEHFGKFLSSLGFDHVGTLDPPKDGPSCFKRTIYVYRRRECSTGDDNVSTKDDLVASSTEFDAKQPVSRKRKIDTN